MTNFELKDAILEYIIETHQKIKDEKKDKSYLPTSYDEVREHFKDVDKERFRKHFLIVRDEFLEEKPIRPPHNSEKQVRVFWENKAAKPFLYDEDGYTGRHNKRVLESELANATKDSSKASLASAKASKSSTWAAWGSTITAVALLVISLQNCSKENELVPLLIDAQKLNSENKSEIVTLKNRIKELEKKIVVLSRNDTTAVP
ncbi:hypothetical protein OKW21_005565 [Catalinimonas alkaloidigena]|uniref:hypothetical protein n=1 Tax=Catalinimonas alkaloidigena TaxID=1075417 RepID=UPI0024062435|nr:hypothetical protein [Catalinimonas alkaloidigena]MDF9800302.1 hypothetical protein [Catalinimonas alkaloidigena]